MSELALFETLSSAAQASRAQATERAERIRTGMVAVVTLPREVKAAWASRDWIALDYASWDAYIVGEFGEHRLPMLSREQRRELVADLREGGLSTRAIGAVLGVDQKTVVNDLRSGEEISSPEPATVTGADGKSHPSSRSSPPQHPSHAPGRSLSKPPTPTFFDDEVVDAEIVDDVPPRPTTPLDPEAGWSPDERDLLKRLRGGETIVVSMRDGRHNNLIGWADAAGLYMRVDRRTEWGNPFEMPADGDRDTVIANFEKYYLPHKPSLLRKLDSLRGKALGCWCAPDPCHGDVLAAWAEGRGEQCAS